MYRFRSIVGACALSALPCTRAWNDAAPSVEDEVSCLQASRNVGRIKGQLDGEAARAASDEVHIVFTLDCFPYVLWQSELLFYSAQRVGQRGPITEIISGCTPEKQKAIEERHATLGLPAQYTPYFVPEFNDNRSHVINKPFGISAWLKESGAKRDIVAVVDPDFIFVRPLTAAIDSSQQALGWPTGADRPQRVQKGLVVAQRWGIFANPTEAMSQWLPRIDVHYSNMTDTELFTWICSGSTTGPSGCTDVSEHEVGTFHAAGVPYLAHREDWEGWLADSWKDTTARFHEVFNGYIVEMYTWAFANIHRGQRELLVENLQICSPGYPEDWDAVDSSTLDPCTDPMDEVLGDPNLGHFVHYTHYTDGWNKRWFSRPRELPHAFGRCNMTVEDPGMKEYLAGDVSKLTKRQRFTTCVARRMFAGALKRTCAGQPAAVLVDGVSAGFTL